MNDLAFMTLKVVVSICSILITFYAVPYLHELQKNERYKQLFELIAAAVRAAEQTIRESGMGVAKKEKVMAYIKKFVDDNHFPITEDELSDLVEASVWKLKHE